MDTLNIPTKRNLLLARHRLALARKGYDLLDKKRYVLVNELAAVQKQAGQVWDGLYEALHLALAALQVVHAEIGHGRVLEISRDMPCMAAVKLNFRSIMGVDVPMASIVSTNNNGIVVPYALSNTTVSLDEAVLAWEKVREHIVSWAVIENTVLRLKFHISKTQKRANALENITIPKYEARIKYIQERLEERERDELARLKKAAQRKPQSRPRYT